MKRVHIDTDPGIDDLLALALLSTSCRMRRDRLRREAAMESLSDRKLDAVIALVALDRGNITPRAEFNAFVDTAAVTSAVLERLASWELGT